MDMNYKDRDITVDEEYYLSVLNKCERNISILHNKLSMIKNKDKRLQNAGMIAFLLGYIIRILAIILKFWPLFYFSLFTIVTACILLPMHMDFSNKECNIEKEIHDANVRKVRYLRKLENIRKEKLNIAINSIDNSKKSFKKYDNKLIININNGNTVRNKENNINEVNKVR